ncbi:MAG: RsmE family RNA methyltransferase [Candidatus Hydrogenedentales bacterium]|jgi:16S rRNA (uracil1498-N3)-methyltransferase
MSHIHRFYASPGTVQSESLAVLQGDEAHHALHVVRARTGDAVALFDGKGGEWLGSVSGMGRHEVRVDIAEHRETMPPKSCVTLLQATLNNQKAMEELIRRCTEIGVRRFVFFPSRHSERRPPRSDKWERIAIEACKQCGRLWLPTFEDAKDLDAALAAAHGKVFVATQHANASPIELMPDTNEAALFVGPEGDFTDEEVAAILKRGAHPLSLGDATYRSEAAAFLASALLLYELGGLGPRGRLA